MSSLSHAHLSLVGVPPSSSSLCQQVDDALSGCDLDRARAHAEQLWHQATGAAQATAEAPALLRLAQCDLADAKPDLALERAKSAAAQFESMERRAEEINALATCSRAANCLSRRDEALETAMLAMALAEQDGEAHSLARAGLALGAAHGWAGHLQSASAQLDRVRELGESQEDIDLVIEACCERAWAEAAWHAGRRGRSDEPVSVSDNWRHLLAVIAALPQAGDGRAQAASLKPGVDRVMYAWLAAGLCAAWSGDIAVARQTLARYHARARQLAPAGWLTVGAAWLEAECHWHEGHWDAAALQAELMVKWSQETQHQPMRVLGLQLLVDAQRRLGRAEEALRLLDTKGELERHLRDQEYEVRTDAVQRRLALRETRQHLVTLESESTKFRRWAHEDELTGLANVRRFNELLPVWTEQARERGEDLCVAMIDVDHFKPVNDRHGHLVGDQVLRVVARAIAEQSRVEDLQVRWGGDEFAILFRNTALAEAEQVAERIQARVATHDWSTLLKGGRVTVSVGVALAEPGDTKRTLVARSDARLYARKAVRDLQAVLAQVPAPMLNGLVSTLRQAQRVVMFVGADSADGAQPSLPDASLAGFRADPQAFNRAWSVWRQEQLRSRRVDKSLQALVRLSHQLRQVNIVTERVDGLLAMAGAVGVLELYGQAFEDRCDHCGRVQPNRDHLHCLACGHPEPSIRPAVWLHGEAVEPRSLAGAEQLLKRADVVLVTQSSLSTRPGSLLVEKAAARGAQVVIVGEEATTNPPNGSWWLPVDEGLLAGVLCQLLSDPSAEAAEALQAPGLSAAGLSVRQLLIGRGRDRRGLRLQDFLDFGDWELSRRLPMLAWLFPLATASHIDPDAPTPTSEDFALLAEDAQVRTGQRRALERVQRYYGFAVRDGEVVRAPDWRASFGLWAPCATHHDLLISRILASATACGLGEEARGFLRALAPELVSFRGTEAAAATLCHWDRAVGRV